MSKAQAGVAGPIPMPHNPLLGAGRPVHAQQPPPNAPMLISGFRQYATTGGDIVSAPDRKQPPMVKSAWQRESKSQTFGIAEPYGMSNMPQSYGVFPRISTQRRARHLVLSKKPPAEVKRNLLFTSHHPAPPRTNSAARPSSSAAGRTTAGNAAIPRAAFSPEERKKVFRNLQRTVIQLPKFSTGAEEATFFRIIRWIEETNNAMACWDELNNDHKPNFPGLRSDSAS